MTLDATDRRLLSVLQRRGRISNADLAEAVNLSASACHRRVGRLEKDGYIRGYVALLDAHKLGMSATIFVEITLSTQADDVLEAFERAVRRIPDVLECHHTAGAADYILRQHLARLPGVAKMQSSFSLRTVSSTTALPL